MNDPPPPPNPPKKRELTLNERNAVLQALLLRQVQSRLLLFDIQLTCQPANSPDLNVLDLGFFNSIQSLQHQSAPRTIDELITVVQDSFQQLHQPFYIEQHFPNTTDLHGRMHFA